MMTGILRSVEDLRDSAGSSSPWGGGWLADMIGQGQTEDHCNSIEQARFASGTLFSMNSKHFWGFFCWMQGRGDREGPDLLRDGLGHSGLVWGTVGGQKTNAAAFLFFWQTKRAPEVGARPSSAWRYGGQQKPNRERVQSHLRLKNQAKNAPATRRSGNDRCAAVRGAPGEFSIGPSFKGLVLVLV